MGNKVCTVTFKEPTIDNKTMNSFTNLEISIDNNNFQTLMSMFGDEKAVDRLLREVKTEIMNEIL